MQKPNIKNINRKIEFLETAQALFNEKGFENTSVDDIVERMGVAKGLFYYYFGSKEELLTITMERLVDEIHSSVNTVMEKKGLSALQRYKELIMASSDITSRSKTLIAYFHEERNQSIHLAMERRSREFMIPALEQIIIQGNQEGVFNADHPHETAIAVIATMNGIGHAYPFPQPPAVIAQLTCALQHLTERLLVMEPGTFQMFEDMLPPEIKMKDFQKTSTRRMKKCSI